MKMKPWPNVDAGKVVQVSASFKFQTLSIPISFCLSSPPSFFLFFFICEPFFASPFTKILPVLLDITKCFQITLKCPHRATIFQNPLACTGPDGEKNASRPALLSRSVYGMGGGGGGERGGGAHPLSTGQNGTTQKLYPFSYAYTEM